MNTPLITLALSVYNVEPYLRQSLETIINQTYKNIEILCIDDCSKDKTYAILEEYASKDSRIKLFKHESNQGLSVSRNRALRLAMGEYILMLDGDDLFDLLMVEKAYNKVVETKANVVMWDYCAFYYDDTIPKLRKRPSELIGFDITDKVSLLKRPSFMWVKMFRTQWLREIGVYFTPGLTKQDIPIWWKVVTSADNVAIIPERLSYYRQNPQNTSSRKDKSVFSLAYVMDLTGKYLKDSNLYDTYKNEYLRSRLNLLQGMYDFIKPEFKAEAMDMIRERLDADTKAYIYSVRCECSSRTIMFYKGYFYGSILNRFKYNTLLICRSIYRKVKGQ